MTTWHPLSEKERPVPEEGEERKICMVTTEDGSIDVCYWWKKIDGSEMWYRDFPSHRKVIAWAELPEPFTKEKQTHNT